MALAACCLRFGPWALDPEAWRLQLLAIDPDPGAKLLPSIAHDLELSCDGQQLSRRCMWYFYCEFFHTSALPCFVLCLSLASCFSSCWDWSMIISINSSVFNSSRSSLIFLSVIFFHWMVGLFSGRAASFIVRISFFTSRRISSRASAILFNCFVSMLYLFLNSSYYIPVLMSSLQLGACGFFLFL